MIDRLTSIGLGAAKLLLAEAEGLLIRAQRSMIWGAAAFAGGFAILLACIGLLVAATAAMAARLGWVPALTISSLFLATLGLCTLLVSRRALSRSVNRRDLPPEINTKVEEATEQIKGEKSAEGAPGPLGLDLSTLKNWESVAAAFVAKNPGAIAGGALCALAIVGPARMLRLAGQGMMLAGLVSGIRKEMGQNPPAAGS